MENIRVIGKLPEDSLITKDLSEVDYFDSYMINKQITYTIEEIAEKIFTLPKWVKGLLKIRYYLLVKPFGLKTGIKKEYNSFHQDEHSIRNNFGDVSVLSKNENEIVLGNDDKHLNYRVSVLKIKTTNSHEIYLSTVVHFNNNLGKIYFSVIKPFHKVFVKLMLEKI